MFISASKDTTAKLWDMDQLEYKKTYKTERPVNSASISPNKDHVVLGGGQVRFIHDTSYFQRALARQTFRIFGKIHFYSCFRKQWM